MDHFLNTTKLLQVYVIYFIDFMLWTYDMLWIYDREIFEIFSTDLYKESNIFDIEMLLNIFSPVPMCKK